MKTIEVTARRWDGGWELHIADHGVTQVRRLTEAEEMVRDYLRLDDVEGAETATIRVVAEIQGITPRVNDVKEKAARAAALQLEAAAASRSVARDLVAAGLTGSEVGVVMGIKKQRVSQLLRG
ncbi:hypothetical protein OG218_00815 [Kineococcus sp. NBC_00420]|uniref:hypothetical protein n=1 Tax=Kineococcus sp. NBC_00420 TaxID=2903564 RepID=UPI002E1B28F0